MWVNLTGAAVSTEAVCHNRRSPAHHIHRASRFVTHGKNSLQLVEEIELVDVVHVRFADLDAPLVVGVDLQYLVVADLDGAVIAH